MAGDEASNNVRPLWCPLIHGNDIVPYGIDIKVQGNAMEKPWHEKIDACYGRDTP